MALQALMVPGAGIEPAWGYPRGIFVPATAFAAALRSRIWSLDFLFAVSRRSRGLGRGRQVSTLSAQLASLSAA